MKKVHVVILLMIAAGFLLSLYFYPELPAEIASHWSFEGEVNGYLSKPLGAFIIPLLTVGLFLLYLVIPKIGPLRENIAKFRDYFDSFIAIVIGFLVYIHVLVLAWNLGYRLSIGRFMIPAIAFLFYYAGVLIENAERNWFIGIRTPWTLSSEKVWDKVHRRGSKLFKASGLIALFGVLFPKLGLYFVIAPVVASAVYSVVYSYLEYRKVEE